MRTLLTPLFILCLILPQYGLGKSDDHELKQRLRVSRMGHAWDHCGRMTLGLARGMQTKTGWAITGSLIAGGILFLTYMAMNEKYTQADRMLESFIRDPLPHEDDVDPKLFANMVQHATYSDEGLQRTAQFLSSVKRGNGYSIELEKAFRDTFEANLVDLIQESARRRRDTLTRILYLFRFLPEEKGLNYHFLVSVATNSPALNLREPILKQHSNEAMETLLALQAIDSQHVKFFKNSMKHIDLSEWMDDFYLDLERSIFWRLIDLYYLTRDWDELDRKKTLEAITVMTKSEQDALLMALEFAEKDKFQGAPGAVLHGIAHHLVKRLLAPNRNTLIHDYPRYTRITLSLVEHTGLSPENRAHINAYPTKAYAAQLQKAHNRSQRKEVPSGTETQRN